MASATIGLLHPGDMGSMVGASARASGLRVLWASEGRSPQTLERAAAAGLEDMKGLAAVVAASQVVLSVCPPHAAVDLARVVAAQAFSGIYVDGNAVSPQTGREIGRIVEKGGATFVDGGIIGPPPRKRGTTRLYLSGEQAGAIARLFEQGPLETIAIDGGPGAASALKMAYAAQTKVYRAADAPERSLAGESVAVLGYGNLGRSAALNLRDSGVKVRIGNREDEYAARARAEGFEVTPIALAAVDDIVFVLLPDEVIPEVFAREIAPALRPGSAIAFGSGYSLAFGLIRPPDTVDVLLVAPRMAGSSARTRYLAGQGFWACVGVEADRSERAQQRMLGLADALGVLRAGAVEMSAAVEASLDLFVEQTMGSLLGMAIMIAFDVGREAGIPAEALVMEMYMSGEMEVVFKSFRESGFFRSSEEHGPTAVFGGLTRTLEMDREAMAKSFRTVLDDIRSGAFAKRFQDEARHGYPMLDVARAMMHGPSPITDAEERLRSLAGAPAPPPGEPGRAGT